MEQVNVAAMNTPLQQAITAVNEIREKGIKSSANSERNSVVEIYMDGYIDCANAVIDKLQAIPDTITAIPISELHKWPDGEYLCYYSQHDVWAKYSKRVAIDGIPYLTHFIPAPKIESK